MIILHLTATNDKNGNPRRLWARMDAGGRIITVWPEGYSGENAIPKGHRDIDRMGCTIEITPKEYRRLLKEYCSE